MFVLFFFIRHSDKCLYAEPALDDAVRGMVTARFSHPPAPCPFTIPTYCLSTSSFAQKMARKTHTEMSGNFHVCIQPEPVK